MMALGKCILITRLHCSKHFNISFALMIMIMFFNVFTGYHSTVSTQFSLKMCCLDVSYVLPLFLGAGSQLKVLYSMATPGTNTKSLRHIPQAPERILDAPELLDDYC